MPVEIIREARTRRLQRQVSAFGGSGSLAAVQAAFQVGERIAPHLSAATAQRVWFRVPPAPSPSRRNRGVEVERRRSVALNGQGLNVVSWGSGPVVLLVHGWSGWWQQFSVYVEPLVKAGFQVVAWDAPSHGDSGPGRHGHNASSVVDMVDGVVAVATAMGEIHGVVAHSVGAMAACVALTQGVQPARMVLVSPSVSATDQIDYLSRRLGWGERTQQLVRRRVLRRFGIDLDRFEIPQLLAESDLEVPAGLFFSDSGDLEVPPDSALRLAESWPGARIISTSGLDHFRVLWSPETVRETVEFLAS